MHDIHLCSIISPSLGGSYYHSPSFTGEDTEAQRGKVCARPEAGLCSSGFPPPWDVSLGIIGVVGFTRSGGHRTQYSPAGLIKVPTEHRGQSGSTKTPARETLLRGHGSTALEPQWEFLGPGVWEEEQSTGEGS